LQLKALAILCRLQDALVMGMSAHKGLQTTVRTSGQEDGVHSFLTWNSKPYSEQHNPSRRRPIEAIEPSKPRSYTPSSIDIQQP